MAVQYTTYNTDGTTRTFPSTKHIATIQHVGVYLKRVVDNVWVVVNINDYTLVQNSIIFDTAPDSVLYAQVEVRVADDATEITTSPSDIALVAGSIINVDTVAANITTVNTVATNIGAVNTTSGSIANVNTVAANIANVNLTAGNTANINAVVANSANVTAVGLDLLEPISEINTVAIDIVNVNTVGTNIASVNTVATNIANVNSIATTIVPNIAEILLADTNAIIATTQAGIATTQAGLASTSATDAQLRAWEAEAERMTADSYATELEDVLVKIYTSNGNGTFTATNTTEYSSFHWGKKALINANFAPSVHASTSKTTPVDADEIPLLDSTTTFTLKKLTWANIKTALTVLFAPLLSPAFTGTPTAPTATAGTNTTQLATTAFVLANGTGIGTGQTWQDVTVSRVLSTTYTNTTGKPIEVLLDIDTNGGCNITVGGVLIQSYISTNAYASITFIVPVGATYIITKSGGLIRKWSEIR